MENKQDWVRNAEQQLVTTLLTVDIYLSLCESILAGRELGSRNILVSFLLIMSGQTGRKSGPEEEMEEAEELQIRHDGLEEVIDTEFTVTDWCGGILCLSLGGAALTKLMWLR